MFRITEGTGFQMTFANGWTVSVQWEAMKRMLGEEGSPVAVANWWNGSGDIEVSVYLSPDEVLALMVKLAARS